MKAIMQFSVNFNQKNTFYNSKRSRRKTRRKTGEERKVNGGGQFRERAHNQF